MTPIALALALAQTDPVKEVFARSVRSMDGRQVFSTTYSLETTLLGKKRQSAYYVQARRPAQAFIARLDSKGQPLNGVAVNASGRVVTKMEVRQHMLLPAASWKMASSELMSQIPELDGFVLAGCGPDGWAGYLEQNFTKHKGWKARFEEDHWKFVLQAPSGQVTLLLRSGDFLPVEMRLTGKDSQAVWKLVHKTTLNEALFKAPSDTRRVARFENFAPPKSLDAASKPLVTRLFKNFDVVKSLAVETEAGGTSARLYARGNRVRQTAGGVDWTYDGATLTIQAGGKVKKHKANGSQMLELVAEAGGRLDPIWSDLLSGANPFRRLLSGAEVKHKASIDSREGRVALLEVKSEEEIMTLAIRERDGRLVSLSRIPRHERAIGMSVSSTRKFTYLDEAILAQDASFKVGNGA